MEESREARDKSPAEEESVSMENLSEQALDFEEPKRGQLREGVVLAVRNNGLVVDIGAKRDGFVPTADLDKLSEEERAEYVEVDATVPTVVTEMRGGEDPIMLSINQALELEDWREAERLKKEEEVVETEVAGSNRGGLLVEIGHLQGFVPMSQLIGFSRIRDAKKRYDRLNAMVGEKLLLKVIEVNRQRRRLILSQRAAAKEWRAQRRQRLLEELEPGQVRSGRLSQITDFGLFVNLGGLDGLVHVSELSWGRIEDPESVYKVGQQVKVKVLNVDRERERIGLSIKALQPDPWESVAEKYSEGDLVTGHVTQVVDFGVFVELEPGIEGLLHNSELVSPAQREELESGDEVLVKVIRVEPRRRRIGLSVRQVRLHEWEAWHAEREEEAAAEPEPEEAPEAEPEAEPEPEAPEAEEAPEPEPEAELESEPEEAPEAEPEAEPEPEAPESDEPAAEFAEETAEETEGETPSDEEDLDEA